MRSAKLQGCDCAMSHLPICQDEPKKKKTKTERQPGSSSRDISPLGLPAKFRLIILPAPAHLIWSALSCKRTCVVRQPPACPDPSAPLFFHACVCAATAKLRAPSAVELPRRVRSFPSERSQHANSHLAARFTQLDHACASSRHLLPQLPSPFSNSSSNLHPCLAGQSASRAT